MKSQNDKLRVDKDEKNTYITLGLKMQNECDTIECRSLMLSAPEFIIPVAFNKNAEETTLRDAVSGQHTQLNEFEGSLDIEQVLKIYRQAVDALEDCGDWYLYAMLQIY